MYRYSIPNFFHAYLQNYLQYFFSSADGSIFVHWQFMSQFLNVKYKSQGFQQLQSFQCHTRRRPRHEKFVLATLTLHPRRQWMIRWVVRWYVAVTISLFEGHELVQLLHPRWCVRIPHKADRFQLLNTKSGHGGCGVTLLELLVLVSLSLDPSSEDRIFWVRERNIAVSILELVLDELQELFSPLLLLVWAKAWNTFFDRCRSLHTARPLALARALVVFGEAIFGPSFQWSNSEVQNRADHALRKVGVIWLERRGKAIISQEDRIRHWFHHRLIIGVGSSFECSNVEV